MSESIFPELEDYQSLINKNQSRDHLEMSLSYIISYINSNKYNLSEIKNDQTPLMYACANKMSEVAIKLIESGKSFPEYIDNDGNTALIYTTQNKMSEVALKLIETGKSVPEQANHIDVTALIYACDNIMSEVAIKLIETGKSNPDHISEDGKTALIVSCENRMSEVALKLIETGKSVPEQIDESGITALMYACANKMNEVAIKLIETGKSVPEQIHESGDIALTIACKNRMSEVALKLIETEKSVPEQIDENGDTALTIACKNIMSEVALKLIETGKSVPEQINREKNTALIIACLNKMSEVALKLIETGKSVPEQFNQQGFTALIIACLNKMSEVALKLIETGKSVPEYIFDRYKTTALMYACANNMSEVALKLIETGKSVPEQIDENGDTALTIAIDNNMTEVVTLLNKLKTININEKGFDVINQEYKKISDYLSEIEDGICIKVNKQYFLTDKKSLLTQINNPANIKYECKTAGNGSQFILDRNINYNTEYFSMSSIFGLQILVDLKKFFNVFYSNNLLYLEPTSKKVASIISKAFIQGGSGVSADHCQPGKITTIYSVNKSTPISEKEDIEDNQNEEKEKEKDENIIKIQYKTNIYSFPVDNNTTLENIKTLLLNKLLSENVITSSSQNVKFIYKGKIYTDMSIVITNLENDPFGITLQAMVSPKPTSGGKFTKKQKHKNSSRICKRKTKKVNIRKKNNKTQKYKHVFKKESKK